MWSVSHGAPSSLLIPWSVLGQSNHSPLVEIMSNTMMHCVYTGEAALQAEKWTYLRLVSTRPIAHSGRFVCIQNCVGEFGMDTGQPMVTSNVVSNHLSDHHKAYYTYNEMYIQMYNAVCHMETWQNFIGNRTYHFCYQKDCFRSMSVSVPLF